MSLFKANQTQSASMRHIHSPREGKAPVCVAQQWRWLSYQQTLLSLTRLKIDGILKLLDLPGTRR